MFDPFVYSDTLDALYGLLLVEGYMAMNSTGLVLIFQEWLLPAYNITYTTGSNLLMEEISEIIGPTSQILDETVRIKFRSTGLLWGAHN